MTNASSGLSPARERLRALRLMNKVRAEQMVGKWVTGDESAIEIALCVNEPDTEYEEGLKFSIGKVFKVINYACASVIAEGGHYIIASRYVKEFCFEGKDPTQEEINMYSMLGIQVITGDVIYGV